MTPVDPRRDLVADCSRCVGICCVVPAFAASADFAIDKPAGVPCPHLRADHLCGIHDRLRERGFGGCGVFDCFGAGQQVVEVTFGGRPPEPAATGPAFTVVRALHECLWLLAEAGERTVGDALGEEVATRREHLLGLTRLGPDAVAAVDVDRERAPVGELLERVSAHVRGAAGHGGGRRRRGRRGPAARPDARVDLVGADLRRTDLVDTSLRGALLLGADLRGADLTRTDVLGADLRGADLRGALLADALFLTGPQLEAARGDAATTVPPWLRRPGHFG